MSKLLTDTQDALLVVMGKYAKEQEPTLAETVNTYL